MRQLLSLLVATFVCTFPSLALAQGTVKAALGFEEGTGTTAADSSGNGNTALLRNGPTWGPGRIGQGLTFDGVNDYVEVADADTLDASSAVTLSAWIKPVSLTAGMFLTKEAESTGLSYGFQFYSGLLQWVIQTAGGATAVDTGSSLPLGQWSHVAGTYDGAHVRLYLNGEPISSWPASGALVTGTRPLWIGTNRWQSGFFSGSLDEIRVYDRALSQSEIQNDMTLAIDPTAPLQVTASTPANGALGLRTVTVSAAFSSPMNPTSLTSSTVKLETLAGAAVPATLSYDSPTRTVTLTPSASLGALTTYRATIESGVAGVAGNGGATLPSDVTWAFTTAAPNGVGGLWAFEDGVGTAAVDSSGNGNTGLLRNGPTWSAGQF